MKKEKSFLRFAESEREKNATNKYGWESENFKIERWQRQTAADTKTHTQHGTKHNKNPQASITIFHTWTRKKTAAAKNNNIENCMSEWYAWYITVLLDYNVQLQSPYTKQWTLYVYLCIVRPQKKHFIFVFYSWTIVECNYFFAAAASSSSLHNIFLFKHFPPQWARVKNQKSS